MDKYRKMNNFFFFSKELITLTSHLLAEFRKKIIILLISFLINN